MPLARRNGKLLTVGGKLATGADCCCAAGCGSCSLPGGNCPHSLSVTVQYDGTGFGDGCDLLEFIDAGESGGVAVDTWDNGDGTYAVETYAWGVGVSYISYIPSDQFLGVPFTICIGFTQGNDEINVDVSVGEFGSGSFTMDTPDEDLDTLNVGCRWSWPSHLSISCVSLLANPDSDEVNFNFPADSFDSFTGGASVVDGVLRLDDDGSQAYATKTVDPGYSLFCCCNNATLVCDQISSSGEKCGFAEFVTDPPSEGPPHYYLAKVDSFTLSNSSVSGIESIGGSISTTFTSVIDPDTCDETDSAACSGGIRGIVPGDDPECSQGCHLQLNETGDGCDCFKDEDCIGNCTSGCNIMFFGCFFDCDDTVTTPTSISTSCSMAGSDPEVERDCGGSESSSSVLSNEDTTSAMIGRANAALPAYDDDFNDSCVAERFMDEDESFYSFSRFRYKFTFPDPLVKDCKICWIERTYDEDDNPINDNQMCATIPAEATESDVYEVMEPAENGTINIVYPVGICCTSGECSVTDEFSCSDEETQTFLGMCCSDDCCDPNPCEEPS